MLSKSRILALRQCRRRLWLEVNRPELRVYGPETRRRFAQGHQLNTLVQQMYPHGTLIGEKVPLAAALKLTAGHLARSPGRPLFEATFSKHRVLVRADIFARTDGGFQLTEVKSSTRVKPHHLVDCAIQHWVICEAGYPVDKTILAHIDTRFIYRGDNDYSGLLRHVDVSEHITQLLPNVAKWVADGLETLGLSDEPAIAIGPHCKIPFTCPFVAHCGPRQTEYPVTLLPGGGRIIAQLIDEGIGDVRDIPPGRLQKPLQQRVRQATLSGKAFIGAALRQTLQALPYPRYYLDFESIQFAIPRWAGTHPYEQIPFQWSCHIESTRGALRQEEFLDTSGAAPMRACAEALISALGGAGPIFTYSNFERMVISRLAAQLPDLAPQLRMLVQRLFDLLPLIKTHYYHPAMKGSFSIKAVLPTIAPDLSYDDLDEVHDGLGAQSAYEELINGTISDDRMQILTRQLREYCARDSLAMLKLVQFFTDGD